MIKTREKTWYCKKCPSCSQVNEKESKWCLQCGKAISSVEVCRHDTSKDSQRGKPYNPNARIPHAAANEVLHPKEQLPVASFTNLHIAQQYPHQNNNNVNFFDSPSLLHFYDNTNLENVQTGFLNVLQPPQLFPLFDPAVCPVLHLSDLRYVLPVHASVNDRQPLSDKNSRDNLFLKYKKRPPPKNFTRYKKEEKRNKNPSDIEGKENNSSVGKLPEETLLYIFSFLSKSDLSTCTSVCKHFQRIASDESLWKVIVLRKHENLTDDILKKVACKHPTSLTISYCNLKNATLLGFCNLLHTCSKSLERLVVSGNSGNALVGDVFLIHVSTRCTSIHSLDVSWSNIGNKGLKSISRASNKLLQVSLNGCQAITDQSIKAIAEKHYNYLQILEVFGCFNLTQTSINLIACKCKEIRVLNLGQCHKVKNSSLCAIAKGLNKLESLDIRGCKLVHDCALREIIVHCHFLSNLVIANCPSITDETLLSLASLCPQLKCLDVCGVCKISDQGVESLAKSCSLLVSLDISSTQATGRSIHVIATHSQRYLESLKLSFCHGITDESLHAVVTNCKQLKCLHLYGCHPVSDIAKLMDINPALVIEK